MDIELPSDCGNAPRMLVVSDIVASWARGDADAVGEWLADDASWTVVGAATHTGSEAARAASPPMHVERLVVQSIVTHGRLASCDGFVQGGATRIAFSHAIRFAGAAKTAKVAAVRSYCIETQR